MANNLYEWCIENDKKHLIDEWDTERNKEKLGLEIENISYGSGKYVHWQCTNHKHKWQAPVNRRSKKRGSGCPYCSNRKVLPGFNDLVTTNPKLAKEWHPTKNGNLKPTDVTNGSKKKIHWKCSNNHEWNTSITNRSSNDAGCPICTNQKVLPGYNDLTTTNPELAKEWHPTKNGNLKPTDVTSGSDKKAYWQCDKGHEWESTVSNRSNGSRCPHCYNNGTSFPEQYLYHALKSKFNSVSNRTKINGYEYDIHIEKMDLLIEYDGIYWHRTFNDKTDREKEKVANAKENNFDFIRVAESKGKKDPNIKNKVIKIHERPKIEDLNAVVSLLIQYVNNIYKLNIDTSIPDDLEQIVRNKMKNF